MLTLFSIHGFRGVHRENISLSKYQAIIGENGSGKTHILEGIHLLSGGLLHYFQSPREEESIFLGRYREDIGEKTFGLSRTDTKDSYTIQGGKVTGKKYHESLPYKTVFISPFDMNLLYFAPSIRRDYIDSILDRAFLQFRSVKRDYENSMRQRNALLKRIREGECERSELPYWDKKFAENANIYGLYRKKWYGFVEENIHQISTFLQGYSLECRYESKYLGMRDMEGTIHEYLLSNRERDIITGHTHIGPHLDDFGFYIDTGSAYVDASIYLSRGENKILLLGLKQIEIFFLKKHLGLPIVLLLDDLFAELDTHNAERLIEKYEVDQIILTTQRELPKNEKWDHFSCINLTDA